MNTMTWPLLAACCLLSCATATTAPNVSRALIFFSIEPPDAEVFIDGAYQGRVDGWAHSTIPVEVGMRRVELRRAGYTPERFDISVASTEEVSISLSMVPELDVTQELQTKRIGLDPREGIR
jgi:hypothetical protein